jgi:2-iminobutanoate/2-iminopropanoate deaminase
MIGVRGILLLMMATQHASLPWRVARKPDCAWFDPCARSKVSIQSLDHRLDPDYAAARETFLKQRRSKTMTDQSPSPATEEPSRRDLVAAVTVAAVAGAASSAQTPAHAQGRADVRYSNPPGMSSPPAYSHVVEVNGPHRTVYLAGQTGVDATGKVAEGFRAQAVQVMENIKTALASVGGGFEHVVKLNSYLTNIEANGAEFREVRASYFPNRSALPASTLLQVPRLANTAYLLEVEVIAVLPPRA